MSQHFLLSPAARTLSIAQVLRLSDEEAFGVFQRVRFGANGGEPFCPHCGVLKVYTLTESPMRWKCSGCRRKFSVTSGTIFHSRKLTIRDYLAVIALFCNGLKGVAALHMARDMNINPKSAFVLLHKLREAMGAEVHGDDELGGVDRQAEVDGAYFGKGPRQANRKADRVDRRTVNTERQVVVVARERHGDTRTWVVGRESDAVPMIHANIASGTTVHADEAGGWDILHASYPMMRVNHSVEYKSDEGASTNWAESYFSRLRRSEFGIHHRISGPPASSLRGRNGVAGKSSAAAERHALEPDHRSRPRASQECDLGRLLAPERGMTDHVVSGLIAKRAELAGIIDQLQRQLDQYRADLSHIDGVLRVLAADLDPEMIQPKRLYRRNRYFARNELSRLCLGVFREAAGEPVSIDGITGQVIAAKGFDAGDSILRAAIRDQVGDVVKRLHGRGEVAKSGRGRAGRWQLR